MRAPSKLTVALLCLLGCSSEGLSYPEGTPRSPEQVRKLFQPVLSEGQIYGGDLPDDTVILTYDDGPDEHTLELAQYLNQEGISATFFINGRRICKELNEDGSCNLPMDTMPCDNGMSQAFVANPIYYPESLLHELVMLGHRLANHTTDHCTLPDQDNPDSFLFELQSTQDIIDRHICDGLYLFRAPYGSWDPGAANLAQAQQMLDKLEGPINWDVDGGDWDCFQQGTSVEACGDGYIDILLGRPGRKGIFLNHDRLEFNVGIDGALRLAQYIVPRLKQAGIQFSTMAELLGHVPTGDLACPFDDGSAGAAGAGGSGGADGGAAGAPGGGSTGLTAGAAGAGGVGGATPTSGGAGSSGGGAGGAIVVASGGSAGVEIAGAAGEVAVAMPIAGAPSTPIMTSVDSETTGCSLTDGAVDRRRSDAPRVLWLSLVLASVGLMLHRRRPQ